MHPVLDRIVAELAGGSVGKPGLDPAARHPDRAAVRAVVATVPLLDDRRAADKRNKSYRGPGRNLLRFCVGDFMLTSCAPSGLPSAARAILYH